MNPTDTNPATETATDVAARISLNVNVLRTIVRDKPAAHGAIKSTLADIRADLDELEAFTLPIPFAAVDSARDNEARGPVSR